MSVTESGNLASERDRSNAAAMPSQADSTVARWVRDPHADALKCLAILLVVLGHAISVVATTSYGATGLVAIGLDQWVPMSVAQSPLFRLVYSFHMPLFAFVSGLVLWRPSPDPFLVQVRKRALGLLVPYFSWYAFYYLVATARGRASLLGMLPGLLSVATNPVDQYALWYLYALFICAIVLSALLQLPRASGLLPASALAAIVLASVPRIAATQSFAVAHVLWLYPFVIAGYLVAPARTKILGRRWLVFALGVLLFVPIVTQSFGAEPLSDLLINPLASRIATYVCTLAGAVGVYALYLGLRGPLLAVQAWMGGLTIGIYATHSAIQVTMIQFLGLRSWPSVFVISVALSVLATLVLGRVPLLRTLLLGKGRVRQAGEV